MPKFDLNVANVDKKINYKYWKQIEDSVKKDKIFINSEKYKIIMQYIKRYKSIDFENKENIYLEPKKNKKIINYFKLYK